MKKCYIAGLIGNLDEQTVKANFDVAKEQVIKLGYEPVSPIELPHNHDKTWASYMKEDLIALLKCDCVFAQNNIRFSNGGMIEIETAMKVGINIIHQKQKL